jgi:hypothetical protein
MFIMSWWPEKLNFLPSSAIGIFQESLYRQGYGVKQLFKNYLTPKRAQSVEIWTGTYNVTKSKAQFFCNKKEGTTFINNDRFEKDRILYNCEPLTFTNGNLDLIADITTASASIPVLVDHQPIHRCIYSDGGTSYSSPLSVFAPEILRIVTGTSAISSIASEPSSLNILPTSVDIKHDNGLENITVTKEKYEIEKYSLQLIYFSCYDLYTTSIDKNTPHGIAGEAGMTINAMITSLEVMDRTKAVDLLKILAQDKEISHIHHPKLTTRELSTILKDLNTKKHYVLNLYPHGTPAIDLLDFNGKIIVEKIREVQKAYGAHVWYIE